MPLIEVLGVSSTELTVLDISGCTWLRKLRCQDTKISQLQVERLLVLEELCIRGAGIKHIDLTKLPKLNVVYGCDDNGCIVLTAKGVQRDDDGSYKECEEDDNFAELLGEMIAPNDDDDTDSSDSEEEIEKE